MSTRIAESYWKILEPVKNPLTDRRKRADLQSLPEWPAGSLFATILRPLDEDLQGKVKTTDATVEAMYVLACPGYPSNHWRQLYPEQQRALRTVPVASAEALLPALRFKYTGVTERDWLAYFLETGKIKLKDIEEAAQLILASEKNDVVDYILRKHFILL